jgi:hypothetical protein
VIAVEAGIAAAFVVVAAAGVTGPAWLLVAGLTGHGFKDLWQHRHQYVANTRWWPPFCLVVDWALARGDAAKDLEILVLRYQLTVLRDHTPRLKFPGRLALSR